LQKAIAAPRELAVAIRPGGTIVVDLIVAVVAIFDALPDKTIATKRRDAGTALTIGTSVGVRAVAVVALFAVGRSVIGHRITAKRLLAIRSTLIGVPPILVSVIALFGPFLPTVTASFLGTNESPIQRGNTLVVRWAKRAVVTGRRAHFFGTTPCCAEQPQQQCHHPNRPKPHCKARHLDFAPPGSLCFQPRRTRHLHPPCFALSGFAIQFVHETPSISPPFG
jgi:hypothetical protein